VGPDRLAATVTVPAAIGLTALMVVSVKLGFATRSAQPVSLTPVAAASWGRAGERQGRERCCRDGVDVPDVHTCVSPLNTARMWIAGTNGPAPRLR
jgi:hypothetical protein